MIEVLNIHEVKSIIVETNKDDFSTYERRGANNWRVLMGCSWEEEPFCEEIENAYQRYLKKLKN